MFQAEVWRYKPPAKRLILAALAGLAIVSSAHAQLINFEVPSTLGGTAYIGAATIGSAGDWWNPVAGTPASGTNNGLFTGGTNTTGSDYLSVGTTLSAVTLTMSNSWFYSGGGQGLTNGTADALEGSFLYIIQ